MGYYMYCGYDAKLSLWVFALFNIEIVNLFLCKDIVETHPGLEFLREAPDFHSRYIHTVSKHVTRVVSKISSCRVNTTSRRGIKRLGISFGSIFLLFSNKSSWGPHS